MMDNLLRQQIETAIEVFKEAGIKPFKTSTGEEYYLRLPEGVSIPKEFEDQTTSGDGSGETLPPMVDREGEPVGGHSIYSPPVYGTPEYEEEVKRAENEDRRREALKRAVIMLRGTTSSSKTGSWADYDVVGWAETFERYLRGED